MTRQASATRDAYARPVEAPSSPSTPRRVGAARRPRPDRLLPGRRRPAVGPGLLLRAADGRSWTVRARPQGRRRHRPRARARRRRAAGRRRPRRGRARLGAPLRPDADPHRAARAVRRRLARLRRARHRRQHGARLGPDGLRVRADVGRPRRRDRGDASTPSSPPPATSGSTSCRATRRSRSRT